MFRVDSFVRKIIFNNENLRFFSTYRSGVTRLFHQPAKADDEADNKAPDSAAQTPPPPAKPPEKPEADAMAGAGPEDKPQSQRTEPATPSAADGKAATAALLNTPLGDVLLAGFVKHPGAAGRIIAQELAQAEPPPDATAPKPAGPAPPPPATAPDHPAAKGTET